MNPIPRFTALLSLTLTATLACAQPAPAPWRYVDANTFAVARLDLSSYDRPAFEQWFTNIIKTNADPATADAITKQLHDGPALSLPDKLKQAGATELFAILSLADIPNSFGCIVIPVPHGARADALAIAFFESLGLKPEIHAPEQPDQLLIHAGPLFAATLGDTLLISAGDPARYQHFTPADRPDLAAALTAAGTSPLTAALSPTDDSRKVIEQMMPQLPPPASVPSTVLTHGLRSASLSLTLPPQAQLHLTIQSDNAPAATDFHNLLTKFLTLARNNPGFRHDVPAADQLVDAVTPKLDGDHLTLSLDTPAVDKLATLLSTGLTKARTQAMTVQSISNEKQLLLAVAMYRNDHKDQFPDKLEDTIPYFKGPDTPDPAKAFQLLTTNPAHPDRHPAYTYLKPAGDPKHVGPNTLILHESFDQWPGHLAAGFADGHAELLSNQADFTKLLNQSQTPKPQ